ncbi:MAG: glycosyltransferase, partial [Anaerolineae bacterium]|nr:glycosyltransferase [Anaerolineae bacterium]
AEQAIGARENVTLSGRVPDVRPYVARSTVFIVPLRMGSGTRLKVLEAMAQGMPIVSTSIGCEGLDVVAGEHLLIADTPDEFAVATLRLLQDETLRHHLGQRARQFVVERYDWDHIVLHLEHVYQQVIELARHSKPETTMALRGGQV